MNNKKSVLTVKEITVFGMLGALMYASKLLMEFLPNVHLIGMFIVAETVVYRKKALFPIYVFAFMVGLFNGFGTWWYPYLYIWLPLWGATMLLPQNMNKKLAPIVYMLVSACHGLLYGTLYAPFQALAFGLSFKSTIAWIVAGLPWDLVHGIGNFCAGILIVPVIKVLKMCERITQ